MGKFRRPGNDSWAIKNLSMTIFGLSIQSAHAFTNIANIIANDSTPVMNTMPRKTGGERDL